VFSINPVFKLISSFYIPSFYCSVRSYAVYMDQMKSIASCMNISLSQCSNWIEIFSIFKSHKRSQFYQICCGYIMWGRTVSSALLSPLMFSDSRFSVPSWLCFSCQSCLEIFILLIWHKNVFLNNYSLAFAIECSWSTKFSWVLGFEEGWLMLYWSMMFPRQQNPALSAFLGEMLSHPKVPLFVTWLSSELKLKPCSLSFHQSLFGYSFKMFSCPTWAIPTYPCREW
jgi:hypothetical protein